MQKQNKTETSQTQNNSKKIILESQIKTELSRSVETELSRSVETELNRSVETESNRSVETSLSSFQMSDHYCG
jgi:hypothetical protein